jgi:hypothetical protein
MLKISRDNKQFTCLKTMTLADAGILERYDLQEYIFNSPKEFCQELRQDLMIIDKEVPPSDTVADRIDLLALDHDGNVVIIELKRGSDKFHLLQAIAYAGMIATWSTEQILARAKKEDAETITETDWLTESAVINRTQRILLVAEEYDYEVLVGAEWLYKKGEGVEIDCVRVGLAVDGAAEYLTFTQIFPTPELAEQARKRDDRGKAAPKYDSWEEALASTSNEAVAKFFSKYHDAGVKGKRRYQQINFPPGEKIHVSLRTTNALVDQWCGRFAGDIEFWKSRINLPDGIHTWTKVREDDCLRFQLSTDEDFAAFEKALLDDGLQKAMWSNAAVGSVQAVLA